MATARRLGYGYGEGDGALRWPRHAVAADGELYISDGGNHRVVVLHIESGAFVRSFGSVGDRVGQLNQPHGIAIEEERVYVADSLNHRVAVFERDGRWLGALTAGTDLRSWGMYEEPSASRASQLAPSDQGERVTPLLSYPQSVSVQDGMLYVASMGNDRVVVFDLSNGSILGTMGDVLSEPRSPRAGPAPPIDADAQLEVALRGGAEGQLSWPRAIAADGERVYIADTACHCIKVFTLQGDFIFKFGELGSDDGQFEYPSGVGVFGRHLIVAEQLGHRLQAFTLDGRFIAKHTIEGCGDLCMLSVDQSHVYVADDDEHCVWQFWRTGTHGLVSERRLSQSAFL